MACRGLGRDLFSSGGKCPKCGGIGRLVPREVLEPPGLKVFHFGSGSQWEAHKELQALFAELVGAVRVCDPYFGDGTLASLEQLAHCTEVRFLTWRESTNKPIAFQQGLKAFQQRYPHISMRRDAGGLHDRFILTQNEFILLGQGIKDPGKKDSFVVRLDAGLVTDLIARESAGFDERWDKATPL